MDVARLINMQNTLHKVCIHTYFDSIFFTVRIKFSYTVAPENLDVESHSTESFTEVSSDHGRKINRLRYILINPLLLSIL